MKFTELYPIDMPVNVNEKLQIVLDVISFTDISIFKDSKGRCLNVLKVGDTLKARDAL